MKSSSWWLLAVGLASAGAGLYVAQREMDKLGQSAAAIKPASADTLQAQAVQKMFAMQLPDQDGKAQALAQWRGKPLLVNFWAPWCAPCVREMPALVKLRQDFAGKQLQVIGIGMDNAAAIKEFAAQRKIDLPLLVAGVEAAELSRELGNERGGLPYTVLIGADGRILKSHVGELKFDSLYQELQVFFGGLGAAPSAPGS
ncbi:redoxin family protein [Massilia sp. W12]|uniref:TlpA disulfide reductase family protein n=1 Tax=Massilia sp. W12 TaxID=3126507 RepID=UPI0030D35169